MTERRLITAAAIGAAVKKIRKRRAEQTNPHDWTQQACADRAGMSRTQWTDLEAGRHNPGIDTLEAAAAALEYTLLYVIQVAMKEM